MSVSQPSAVLTAEALAAVGTWEAGEIVIRRDEFQRWAAAAGDRNPLYFDVEFARAHGHPDVVMPGLFLSPNVGRIPVLDAMRPDGINASPYDDLPLPPRRMAGGEEWEFYDHVYPDATIFWRKELAGLEEKHGSAGPFVVMTWITEYRGVDGLVARHIHRLLALGDPS